VANTVTIPKTRCRHEHNGDQNEGKKGGEQDFAVIVLHKWGNYFEVSFIILMIVPTNTTNGNTQTNIGIDFM